MPEPDVEELPDAGARQVANGAVDERPVGLGDAGAAGIAGEQLGGGGAVGGKVVAAAEEAS